MKKYFVLVFVAFVFLGLIFYANEAKAVSSGDVVINEFLSNGTEWVEFFNITSSDIDLSNWHIQDRTGANLTGTSTTAVLSGSISAGGFLVANISGSKLNNGGDIVTLFDDLDNQINEVSYGSASNAVVSAPGAGESAYRTSDGGNNWAISASSTKGTTNSPDTTAPVISLLGDATVNLTVGDSYVDVGTTALDDVDGDITSSIVKSGTFTDTSAAGTYFVTYNVSDATGNNAIEASRTINVNAPTLAPAPTNDGGSKSGGRRHNISSEISSGEVLGTFTSNADFLPSSDELKNFQSRLISIMIELVKILEIIKNRS